MGNPAAAASRQPSTLHDAFIMYEHHILTACCAFAGRRGWRNSWMSPGPGTRASKPHRALSHKRHRYQHVLAGGSDELMAAPNDDDACTSCCMYLL